ncbi:hypothetical protein R3P38DRAFT_3253659 [Favolaschia claudopus]|uniref:Uncharacterized protein n=1 Tax=Favolaschia claudopus TaxID=2862362 RepID=A0AAW0DV75_9AGAR
MSSELYQRLHQAAMSRMDLVTFKTHTLPTLDNPGVWAHAKTEEGGAAFAVIGGAMMQDFVIQVLWSFPQIIENAINFNTTCKVLHSPTIVIRILIMCEAYAKAPPYPWFGLASEEPVKALHIFLGAHSQHSLTKTALRVQPWFELIYRQLALGIVAALNPNRRIMEPRILYTLADLQTKRPNKSKPKKIQGVAETEVIRTLTDVTNSAVLAEGGKVAAPKKTRKRKQSTDVTNSDVSAEGGKVAAPKKTRKRKQGPYSTGMLSFVLLPHRLPPPSTSTSSAAAATEVVRTLADVTNSDLSAQGGKVAIPKQTRKRKQPYATASSSLSAAPFHLRPRCCRLLLRHRSIHAPPLPPLLHREVPFSLINLRETLAPCTPYDLYNM